MRYYVLDTVRGINIISMILYHFVWDVVYITGVKWLWFEYGIGYVWQQVICWIFILLSGFCWSMGKNQWKRGVLIFAAGIIISVVTTIFVPEQKVMFGILTLLGSSMLLMIPLQKIFVKISPVVGICMSSLLFFLLRNINTGYIGFENLNIKKIPSFFYKNDFTAYLGFPGPHFESTDYFSLFPWIFLFIAGYFLYHIISQKNKMFLFSHKGINVIEFIGRHSLLIYLLHQPVIYVFLILWFR